MGNWLLILATGDWELTANGEPATGY